MSKDVDELEAYEMDAFRSYSKAEYDVRCTKRTLCKATAKMEALGRNWLKATDEFEAVAYPEWAEAEGETK